MSNERNNKLLQTKLTVKTENEEEIIAMASKISENDDEELKKKIEELVSQSIHVSYKNEDRDE